MSEVDTHSKTTLKLYSWNVNGIRAVIKKDLLKPFIESEKPDILCLQETKAQPGQAVIDLPDYEEYWNSADKKGYSGTAIFTKVKPLTIMNGFADEIASKYDLKDDKYGSPINEGRVISAEFDKFWIVTVYVPNAKEDLSRLELRYKHWDPAFLEHIKTLEKTKPVLVCGDFNVAHTELDLANPKANVKNHGFTVEERGGFDAYENAGFVDIFRRLNPEGNHYTWWSHWANARTRNVGWRIDYWLVSQSIVDKVSDVKINTDILGSDHCPISLQLTI